MPRHDWDPRSEEVQKDQRAAFDEMRSRCPVAHSDLLHWSLFRNQDIAEVLHDHETFSNAVSARRSVPNGMDPPEHTKYRRIIEEYFTPSRMEAYEPLCREIAKDLVQTVVTKRDVELISDFARAFSVRVQCAFLGWPESMQGALGEWMNLNHKATLAQDRPAMQRVARQFEKYIEQLLQSRRGGSKLASRDVSAGNRTPINHGTPTNDGSPTGNDVTSELMQAKVDGEPLKDEEIISILRNWTAGEVGSITASIGILTHFLTTNPAIQEEIRNDYSLIPEAIEEILRLDGPLVANRRRATRDVEIGGREIKEGEILSVIWVSANRDEEVFDDAATFRWGRDHSDNLLWGAGVHVCPGAPLARLEMRVVMEELLRATRSIRMHPDKEPTRAVYPAGGFDTLQVVLS